MSLHRYATREADGSALTQLTVRLGTAMLVLGLLACMSLILMDRLTTFEISMAMLAAGLLQVSHAVAGYRRGWSGFAIGGSALYLLAASAVLIKPFAAGDWAEWLLVASLGCSGLSRVRAAVGLPPSSARWEVLSGVTSIAAAGMIGAGLPYFSLWPIAFIVVLDIIVEGGSLANAGYGMSGRAIGIRPAQNGDGLQ